MARRLRVLIVAHYFWPENLRINQVADDMIAAGAEVVVLTGHPNYPEGITYPGYNPWTAGWERHPHGFDILRVPVVPRGRAGAVRLFLNYTSFVFSGATIGAFLLRRKQFDVQFVYCTTPVIQGLVALALKRLRGVPVVLWVQDIWPRALAATGFVRNPALLGLIDRVVARLYCGSDLVLGQSHSFVKLIAPQAGETPVEFYPNPGEHRVEATPGGHLDPGVFNVVFAGNIGRAQDTESVLAAAELLADRPDIRITLFGSGSMSEWLATEVSRRGVTNLKLAGRVPPGEMPAIYSACDALLLTLVDDPDVSETVPSKLQSYFGAGKPIIAAVNGEAARIVEEAGAGISCRAQHPSGLAAAIIAIADLTPRERQVMSDSALDYFARHYEPRRLAADLVERLAKIAGVKLDLRSAASVGGTVADDDFRG